MLKVMLSRLPVRGYHVYKKELHEKLKCRDKLELDIESERFPGTSTFPVAVTRHKGGWAEKIGHLPKEFSWCFKVILKLQDRRVFARVKNEVPVSRNGEEIICDFCIHVQDTQETRYALDRLCEIIQEPKWEYCKPTMVQRVMEGDREVIKDWSVTEDNEDMEQDDIPEELANDPHTRSLYEKAIAEGEEDDRSIRVMVIGCYGQGKTSLVKKLLGEKVENVASTNGIDIINFETKGDDKTWERRTSVTDADTEAARRLLKVSCPKQDKTSCKETRKRVKQDVSSSDLHTHTGIHDEAKKRKTDPSNDGIDTAVKSTSEDTIKTQLSTSSSDISIFEKYSQEMKNSSQVDVTKESMSGNIWDFGGQYIFYATHQLFHSRQAIYLLTFDLSKGLEQVIKDEDFPDKKKEKTLKDYIKFWVSSVHSFVGTKNGREPYIILVGTHMDKVDPELDVDEYFADVLNLFDGTKQKYHIHRQPFAVSNTEPDDDEVTSLREEVIRLGGRLAKKRASLPARWIVLEKRLKENQQEKITKFENIVGINREMQFPLEGESQIKLFLKFQHGRGSLFYFNDSELSSYVVLDTQYLIDAFRCIVTSRKFCITNPNWRDAWKRLCEDAVLEEGLVEELWGQQPEKNFLQHKDVLLRFLQRHRIISPVVSSEDTSIPSSTPQAVRCYIVPSLLKTRCSPRPMSKFLSGKARTQVALVYEFENDCIVETIFHRFIAAALGMWPAIVFRKKRMLFEDLSVFEIQDHAGMVFFKDNKLELLVVSLPAPEPVSSRVSDLFRRTFERIVSCEFEKLRVDEESLDERNVSPDSVRCYHELHRQDGSENVHTIEKLKRSGTVHCPDNESHSLKFEAILMEWYNRGCDFESVPKRELNIEECSMLSTAIGKNWELLAGKLGFNKVQIDHIEEDFSRTSRKILEMLTQWQQNQGEKATLDVLVAAIRKIPRKNMTIDEDILKNIIDGVN